MSDPGALACDRILPAKAGVGSGADAVAPIDELHLYYPFAEEGEAQTEQI